MRAPLLAALTIIVTLAGCKTASRNPDSPLIADSHSPIADVPVPTGFSMAKESTSKVVPGDAIRFVDHRYTGGDDPMPVVRFYKEQLPQIGWTLVDQSQPTGKEWTLHFTKKNEDCFVTVSQGTFDTHIRIRIDPVGRNTGNQ